MSTYETCITCRRLKADQFCGLCGQSICRGCEISLEEGAFSFLAEVKPELEHLHYCQACHASTVEPELEAYNAMKAQARGVFFFFDTRKQQIPTLKKSREKIEVKACVDRNETILRLGFIAAQQGYNAVINAQVVATQMRDHGYQKTNWSGVGYPAMVDGDRLDRHFEVDSH
jgi:hypothetical protein